MPAKKSGKRGRPSKESTMARYQGKKARNNVTQKTHDPIFLDSSSENSDVEITSITTKNTVLLSERNTHINSHTEPDTTSHENSEVIPINEITINSEDESSTQQKKPLPIYCDVFNSDSDDDLYECDFSNLKESICNEIKKRVETIKEVAAAVVEIDSDVDLDLNPRPKRRVYNPRLSKKSKQIQDALESVRDDLCSQNKSLETSFLDDIYIEDITVPLIPVRICWGTTYKRYELLRDEPFANLYSKLEKEHSGNLSEIVLSLKGKIITPSDSIKSIGYSITDSIDGGIIQKSEVCSTLENDQISLKIQCSNKRDSVTMHIGKFAKMEVLMEKYANMKNSKFMFNFDGEKLSPSDTPFSLDLEGDECIDAYEIA